MPEGRSAGDTGGGVTAYRVIIWPFLRGIGHRFIMPDWAAITIWRWIFAWRSLDDAELAHELVHVRQWRQHGFLRFIAAYMSESSRAKRDDGDRYRDNKFEVEARRAEEEVRARRG